MRWGWFVAAGAVTVPTAVCGGPRMLHDTEQLRFRWSVERAASVIGTPTTTRTQFGHIWGAGDHCDAEVWVVVEADGPFSPAAGGELDEIGALVWDVTDPEDLRYLRVGGARLPLVDAGVNLFEGGLETVELEILADLAGAPRTDEHPRAYVVQVGDQQRGRFDLLDVRCH